jgi:hypothetical protein
VTKEVEQKSSRRPGKEQDWIAGDLIRRAELGSRGPGNDDRI